VIIVKSPREIELMRVPCRIVAEILAQLSEMVQPGVTTYDLDKFAEHECKRRKVKPAFKGYGGFPYTICSSPNEVVVHGFADKRPLKEGDILSIDFGVLSGGYYGDAALTVPVGKVSDDDVKLMDVTRESLNAGIGQARSGNRLQDISSAVQQVVEDAGFSVVREFVGHGIGRNLHEDPQIPNYGSKGCGPVLKTGMVLAIEPMVNAGSCHVKVLDDGWTAVTKDGKRSAHFEHTVVVTENGAEILTKCS